MLHHYSRTFHWKRQFKLFWKYVNKEIITDIPKQEMVELFILWIKNVHYVFNNEIYIQVDGVLMSSPLGPVLENIMVELEPSVIPNWNDKVKLSKRFGNDTYCFARSEYTDKVLLALNCFLKDIKFLMGNKKITPFLF